VRQGAQNRVRVMPLSDESDSLLPPHRAKRHLRLLSSKTVAEPCWLRA
jgi:hypothetical protein